MYIIHIPTMSNMNNANDLITSGVTFDVDSDVSFGAPKVNIAVERIQGS